jgi:transposase
MTCWRRIRDWQLAGVWDLIHFALLDWLARDDQIDWSRAILDSCCIRAVYGGDLTGPNPTDRAKRGSKRHLICDGRGVPLAVRLTAANRNDSQEGLALVDAIPPLHGERGRPRQRPDCVLGDRGYDAAALRRGLRTRHIVPLLAMRRTAHGSGLGRWRWVVERTFAWLSQFRRLRVRYDRRADIHEAFLSLGCALDLLAVAAQDVEERLSGWALLRADLQVAVGVIASAPAGASEPRINSNPPRHSLRTSHVSRIIAAVCRGSDRWHSPGRFEIIL